MSDLSPAIPLHLTLELRDRSELYASYMPFVHEGGVFVPTSLAASLGDEVLLTLTLPESHEQHVLPGVVAWMTPVGANNGRQQGLGIAFRQAEVALSVRRQIETLLGGVMNSSRPTHTV